MTKPHALYRFYDATEALLYIGISSNPGSRWKQHRDDKPWWTQVTMITLEPHPTRDAVLEAEREAIINERPRYNIVHATATSRPPLVRTSWGLQADDMPDDCHDHCAPTGLLSMYFPFHWDRGLAHYECSRGHTWTCGWGHNNSGEAPENRGRPHHQLEYAPGATIARSPR